MSDTPGTLEERALAIADRLIPNPENESVVYRSFHQTAKRAAFAALTEAADEIASLRARVEVKDRATIDVTAHLAAAISLLEKGGKAAKKAAPSDKMFDQMIRDYKASLDRARQALRDTPDG